MALKAVNERLKSLPPGDERTRLTEYISEEKKHKAALKEANELFSAIEKNFMARLAVDPLPDQFCELQIVVRYLTLLDDQTDLKAKVKEADEALDSLAYNQYPKLSEAEIKSLVVDDKWMARLSTEVQGELDRVSQTLASRIRELAERYATPLSQLTDEVEMLTARVGEHLKKMGAAWK